MFEPVGIYRRRTMYFLLENELEAENNGFAFSVVFGFLFFLDRHSLPFGLTVIRRYLIKNDYKSIRERD